MMNEKNGEKKSFQVIDRRFWATDEAIETAETQATDKPAYVAQLESQLAEKEAKLRAIASSNKISADEIESAKSRIQRDMAKEVERSRKAVVADFLDVLDHLEMALSAAAEGQDLRAVIEGVVMVRQMFLQKLEAMDIRPLDSLGKPFDPSVHEAVSVIPVDDPAFDNQVVAIVKEGYRIGSELLRPAAVAVARFGSGRRQEVGFPGARGVRF